MGLLPRVRRASVFLGVALVLPSATVECSRAKRRHHPSAATFSSGDGKPSLVSPQDGIIREESSIPGVSIWTSKTAAFSRTSATPAGLHATTAAASTSYRHGDHEAAGFSGGCQVSFGRSWNEVVAECARRRTAVARFLGGAVELGCFQGTIPAARWDTEVGLCEQHTQQIQVCRVWRTELKHHSSCKVAVRTGV